MKVTVEIENIRKSHYAAFREGRESMRQDVIDSGSIPARAVVERCDLADSAWLASKTRRRLEEKIAKAEGKR